VRLGTPALTTRGMKEAEMKRVGEWIARAIKEVSAYRLPGDAKERATYLEKFKKELAANNNLKKIREEIKVFTKDFPLPH